jgi:5-methylcytosine-specific restriction endonuclease McrA
VWRSPNNVFYASKAWRHSRLKQLCDHPLCQFVMRDGSECGMIAEHVHHIQPIEEGGARRDPANLQSLCRSHHTAIHRAMVPGEGRLPISRRN